jgi:dedicator of cytokinesis protein 9/10/11
MLKELFMIVIFHPTRPIDTRLPEEVYELDTETECDQESQVTKDIGTKEGYLLKGPEIGSDRIFSNLASKSFKKRYCSMVKEADGTYILEVYKDDKKTDTKLTIVMDFCSDVVKVSNQYLTSKRVTESIWGTVFAVLRA